ncbi:hypothetical protein [Streptomyces sp. NPDC127108]|uniref:hypothetical protein n=1 Tax=Streptomyces sp. NPDC127108 TaxID=3345361 RepID=UPI00363F5410
MTGSISLPTTARARALAPVVTEAIIAALTTAPLRLRSPHGFLLVRYAIQQLGLDDAGLGAIAIPMVHLGVLLAYALSGTRKR